MCFRLLNQRTFEITHMDESIFWISSCVFIIFKKEKTMSVIEKELLHTPDKTPDNPYSLHPESGVVLSMTSLLVENRPPFMDKISNPDMEDNKISFAVYLLSSDDEFSDIARSIEGHVMGTDFNKSAEEVQKESRFVESNSLFFLVVDMTNPNEPKPAASLSVADCLMGPSETIQCYIENFGSESLPRDLTVTEEDQQRGLWDVMAVMSPVNNRKSKAAIWAYSALHKASRLANVHRWIASMTDKEFGSISGLGIPFNVVEGTGKVSLDRPGKSSIHSGFHTINVDKIIESMTRTISHLENAARVDPNNEIGWKSIADIAHIAMDGTVAKK